MSKLELKVDGKEVDLRNCNVDVLEQITGNMWSNNENVKETMMEGDQTIDDLHVRYIAGLAHEVNRAYCASIGDNSQPEWTEAPEWQKESAINGVKAILENPEMTPEDSHNSWMKEKADNGWVYGEVKDPEKKTHPCMVPYSELSQKQRSKDYLFKAVVLNSKS